MYVSFPLEPVMMSKRGSISVALFLITSVLKVGEWPRTLSSQYAPTTVTLYPFYRRLGAHNVQCLLLIDCFIHDERLNELNATATEN